MNYKSYYDLFNSFERKNAPKELFFEGDFTLLFKGVRASIVGSRQASHQGIKRAKLVASALVNNDIIVVSGLAKGIDTIAHQTAIESNGKTIAVLGTPLSRASPSENTKLLQLIKEQHLAISQFPEGSIVFNSNFPKRNKTMALISDATFIIEASEESGTKHQAWEAIRLNRTVYIFEELVQQLDWAKKVLDYGAIILHEEDVSFVAENLPHFTQRFEFESESE